MVSKGGWQGFLSRRSVWASLGDKSIARAELIQQPSPSLPPRDDSSYRKSSGPLLLAREGASDFVSPQELEMQPAKKRLNIKMKAELLFCLYALI